MTIKIYFIRKFRVLLLASSFLLMLAGCSSALHVAAEKGNVKEVLECIDNGADVNGKQGKMQYTPLWYAASEGHADVARLLITRGADVNARGSNSETALMFACEYGHAEVVKLLIESGAEINAKMELEWLEHELRFGWHHDTYNTASSLVLASEYGRLDIVKLLLEKGAQINEDVPIWNPMKTAPDTLTFSPALVYAARGDYRNVVQVLRAKGAIPGPPDMALVIGGISKIKLSDNLPHSVFLRFPDFYGADVVFNAYTNVKWLKLGTQKVGTGFHAGTGKEFIQSRNQVDVSLQVVAGKIYVIRANLWENSWDASVTEY